MEGAYRQGEVPVVERVLIEQVVICWVQYYATLKKYERATYNMPSPETLAFTSPLPTLEYCLKQEYNPYSYLYSSNSTSSLAPCPDTLFLLYFKFLFSCNKLTVSLSWSYDSLTDLDFEP